MGTGLEDTSPDLTRREKPCSMAANPRLTVPVGTTLASGPSPPLPLTTAVAVPPSVIPPLMTLPTPVPGGGRF